MNSDQISTVCSDAQYADHRDPLKIVHRIQIGNVISNWVCCDLFYRRGVPGFSPFAASLIAFQGGFLLSEHPLQNKTVRDTVPVEEDAQCIRFFPGLLCFII